MSNQTPINGISLERYAELGAELDGITDPDQQAEVVGKHGIARADWESAMAGWTARMQEMSDMGQTASRYMQLLNAAVAKTKGNTSVTFEDFCAMSAVIQVFGPQAMHGQYDLSQGDWTTISSHWNTQIASDPMNLGMRRNQLIEAEAARLQSGGQAKPVQIQRSAPGAAPAGDFGVAAGNAQFQAATGIAATNPHDQFGAANAQGAAAMNYSNQVAAGFGAAAAGLGGALNQAFGGSPLVPGRQVLVQWSDGNKYPATLTQNNGPQSQVTFPDGRQIWIESRFLTPS